MGLGKTIQSIAFLNYLFTSQNMRGPFLVVAPLCTLQHWKRTVEDWSTMNCVLYYDCNGAEGRQSCRSYEWYLTDVSMKGAMVQTAELCKFNILITSFEVFLQESKDTFLNLPFQHIIIDEAHRLKNQNAKILSSLKKLPCERILLLTGTPIQNNTSELWTLLNFIEPSKFFSSTKFLEEYGDLSNAEQVEKLHTVLKPYLLRRMKEDVEKSIPPLQETIIDIEMTNIQKTIYKALYENNKGLLVKGTGFNFNASLNNLEMQLRKCCNHPFLMRELQQDLTKECRTPQEFFEKLIYCSGKMILLDKLLDKMIKENHKILIFSQFTNMLVLIEDYLRFKSTPFEKIDGGVKAKERQNSIDRFNSVNSKVNVFLLSTKAGGVGINLTAADVVIIFDSDWNPQNDVQATARAHRIGQENEVKVYRLITKKTYESEMFERASKKLGLDQAIFMGGAFHSTTKNKGEDENLKKLSKNEIEVLLKKGVMGLLDTDNGNEQAMQDIDEILKNSRVAKYSLINGTYSFSKSTFAAQQTDMDLQMDNPNFWSIVFKNSESETEKLCKEFNSKESVNAFKDLQEQKQFMTELGRVVNKLIESKVKMDSYSIDDENKLTELLTNISGHNYFHKEYKDVAIQLISEIQKPSRRCKNIDITKLELTLDTTTARPAAKKKGMIAEAKANEEEEDIYREASDEETNIFSMAPTKKAIKKKVGLKTTGSGQSKAEDKKDEKKPDNNSAKNNGQAVEKKKKKPSSQMVNELEDSKMESKPKHTSSAKPAIDKTAKDNSKASKGSSGKQGGDSKGNKSSKTDKQNSESSKENRLKKTEQSSKVIDEKDTTLKVPSSDQKKPLPTFTYAELEIEDPYSVDYCFYSKDWCRYCGARYTSKFGSGPWGPNSLCKTHHLQYKKRALKASKKEYPELSAPINMDENTEMEYFAELGNKESVLDVLRKRRPTMQ